MTIHYIPGNNGLEIIAIYPSCLEKYLGKTKETTDQKENDSERRKMPMKW
jgi:hypothetical protein